MSVWGPIRSPSAAVKRLVMCSFSRFDSERGSHTTPPLAPPNGTSTRAHFQVIHVASAATSDSPASGWNRIPPLPGPRTCECSTRYPGKMWTNPSSISTGSDTSTTRSGSNSHSATPRHPVNSAAYGNSQIELTTGYAVEVEVFSNCRFGKHDSLSLDYPSSTPMRRAWPRGGMPCRTEHSPPRARGASSYLPRSALSVRGSRETAAFYCHRVQRGRERELEDRPIIDTNVAEFPAHGARKRS